MPPAAVTLEQLDKIRQMYGASPAAANFAQGLVENPPPPPAPFVPGAHATPPGLGPAPIGGPLEDALAAANRVPGSPGPIVNPFDRAPAPKPPAPEAAPVAPMAPRATAPPPKKPVAAGGVAVPPDVRQQALDEKQQLEQEAQNARNEQSRIAGERATENATGLHLAAEDDATRIADDEARTAVENAQIEDGIRNVQARIDDYANTKIDKTGGFGSADTGTKISLSISGILGGVLGVLNGTNVNQAVQNLDRVIDRNIRAQETDLATKKSAVDQQRGALADMMRLTGSKQQARLATRIAYMQNAQMKLAARLAPYEAPEIQARNQEAQALFNEKIATDQAALADLRRKEAMAANANAAAAAKDERRYQDKLALETADRRIAAYGATHKAGEGGASTQDKLSAFDEAFDQAEANLPAFVVPGAPQPLQTDQRKSWESAANGIALSLKSPGMNSETDMQMLKSYAPQPGDSPEVIAQKRRMGKLLLISQAQKGAGGATIPPSPQEQLGFKPVK